MEKLKIVSYKDSSYKGAGSKPFYILINPTGYSFTRKNQLNPDSAIGTSDSNLKYDKTLPSELKLEFLFDGTGVAQTNSGNKLVNKIAEKIGVKKDIFRKKAVTEQLKNFYSATGDYNGSIHKPYNVELTWGEFQYQGMLSEFTIDYKLFDSDGKPLRAIGKATFNGSVSNELGALKAKKNSPDLTHKRTVQDGDTLPLMTERIYGDSKYYLEVAKANGLINFRQLKPGSELYFPPIEKIS
jgi:hypothetical protein